MRRVSHSELAILARHGIAWRVDGAWHVAKHLTVHSVVRVEVSGDDPDALAPDALAAARVAEQRVTMGQSANERARRLAVLSQMAQPGRVIDTQPERAANEVTPPTRGKLPAWFIAAALLAWVALCLIAGVRGA